MSYDKFARPTQHYNTTTVTLDLKIKHVDFEEETSIFTVYAWFAMVSFCAHTHTKCIVYFDFN